MNYGRRFCDRKIVHKNYVNYRLVEHLFPNARKFVWWVLKNVEAQREVATSMDEQPNLNDDELFLTAQQIARKDYAHNSVKEMTLQQRKELAVQLKNKYGASNAQVARIAQLDPKTVDGMFPLAAKRK